MASKMAHLSKAAFRFVISGFEKKNSLAQTAVTYLRICLGPLAPFTHYIFDAYGNINTLVGLAMFVHAKTWKIVCSCGTGELPVLAKRKTG